MEEDKGSREIAFIHLLIAVDDRLEEMRDLLVDINNKLGYILENKKPIIEEQSKVPKDETKTIDKVKQWLKITQK